MKTELLTIEEARAGLIDLITRFFDDEEERRKALEQARWECPPVKGILSDLHLNGIRFDSECQRIVHAITYYWG